jgi:integrase
VWLAAKRKKRRRTTLNGYESHVRTHLKPHLAHYRLDRLNVGAVQAMFDAIDLRNELVLTENAARRAQEARCRWDKPGRPPTSERARLEAERAKLAEMPPYRRTVSAATKQRIRSTLRAALNAAISAQLITFNAASHVELEGGRRPKPRLWTAEWVRRLRQTGQTPSAVMVWTPEQFGTFLDAAEDDRLYAFFHLVGFRGLRRGETVGQDWADVDLDEALLTPAKEIVTDGWTPYESDPKTDDSASTISLDSLTVAVLKEHRHRQAEERKTAEAAWENTGKVFTTETGGWLHPAAVSDAFRRICSRTDLPPIKLRDLKHVSATLQHAAGGDLHTIKETLRHSTITLTSDTYTSLLPEVDREVAEKAALLVPRARPKRADSRDAHASLTQATS